MTSLNQGAEVADADGKLSTNEVCRSLLQYTSSWVIPLVSSVSGETTEDMHVHVMHILP